MTGKVKDATFSFRMFDLYRRFVEILQLNPDFLNDFKAGTPKEEVCRTIIKRTFQSRQSEEKIGHLVRYLTKNAKIIAEHAENTPDNWKDAIKYTDLCIKHIRKYLKRKGIGDNIDSDAMTKLSNDIGEYLHGTPNEKQIITIKDYLRLDLNNPKRNIASHAKRSKNKSKKSSKDPQKSNNSNTSEVDKSSLKMIIKKTDGEAAHVDIMQVENENIICEEPCLLEYTDDSKKIDDNNAEEENLKAENMESPEVLSAENLSTENKVFLTEDTTETVNNLLKKEQSSNDIIINPNKSCDVEYFKFLLRDSPNEYVIVEINDRPEMHTFIDNQEKSRDTNFNDSESNDNLSLKRKSLNCYDHTCIKKFISEKGLNSTANDDCMTLSYLNNDKPFRFEPASIFDITKNESASTDNKTNNNLEINAENKNNYLFVPNTKIELLRKDNNSSNECKNNLADWNETDSFDYKKKYANVVDMTYTDMFKLMETVMAFCEFKNEISLEEFLVLRRTKDKMHWRSLKELKNTDSSK